MTWANITFFIACLIGSALVSAVMNHGRQTETRERALERDLAAANERISELEANIDALQKLFYEAQRQLAEMRRTEGRNALRIRELEVELGSYRTAINHPLMPVTKADKLTRTQMRHLREAILGVFNHADMAILLADLGHDLAQESDGGTFEEIVNGMLNQANREGWIRQMIVEMVKRRPLRPDFQAVAEGLLDALAE